MKRDLKDELRSLNVKELQKMKGELQAELMKLNVHRNQGYTNEMRGNHKKIRGIIAFINMLTNEKDGK